ncbi:hypothetical protein F5887DRAFT_877726 [Amanita rubescens]|nr:hypothetical protein F5887DRAFT_877726 [Amanita rubescens]
MLVEPSSSSPRGQAVLQPAYFTADIFISPLRRDLDALIEAYRDVYSSSSPFALFKHTWLSHRWHWLIFKVFDSRSRHSFLTVTLRLFLEKTVDAESLFTRVVALFAFYTFFYSQPLDTAPPLYSISHIPIAIGTPFFSFSLTYFLFAPTRRLVLCTLLKDDVFYILPPAALCPDNPRELPREQVIDDASDPLETGKRKRGRPSKQDKARRNNAIVARLERWSDLAPSQETQERYKEKKLTLLESLLPTEQGRMAVQHASTAVLERLKEVAGDSEESAGLERAKRVVEKEEAGGLLRLIISAPNLCP